jgi:hypothetical protein
MSGGSTAAAFDELLRLWLTLFAVSALVAVLTLPWALRKRRQLDDLSLLFSLAGSLPGLLLALEMAVRGGYDWLGEGALVTFHAPWWSPWAAWWLLLGVPLFAAAAWQRGWQRRPLLLDLVQAAHCACWFCGGWLGLFS